MAANRTQMPRDVYIRHEPNSHAFFVVYAERKPRTRHFYAQYDDAQRTMADIEKIVRSNRFVRLVCAIDGTPI